MKWRSGELKSPFSGKVLHRDSLHSFSDGEQRFPVISEIPYLRGGRNPLIERVLNFLDDGNEREALILLLSDQDDWASTAAPDAVDLQPLFDNENLTLQAAMELLKYGAVADYFAYRWSDPTFLSGLKLLETHLASEVRSVCEIACGIGHYLREFIQRNIEAIGVDVVFSKLWLARRFVAREAKLICSDANYAFPFADASFNAAFCHDAFYFLPKKDHVASELKRITRGAILIGHAHNANAENYSSGAAVAVSEYARLFGEKALYDDAELTAAFIEKRQPQTASVSKLNKTEAVSLATTPALPQEATKFSAGKQNTNWRINPLLIDKYDYIVTAPCYPSERYRNEYAALSEYLNLTESEAEKLRKFSAGSFTGDEIQYFARRRILVDLPENW